MALIDHLAVVTLVRFFPLPNAAIKTESALSALRVMSPSCNYISRRAYASEQLFTAQKPFPHVSAEPRKRIKFNDWLTMLVSSTLVMTISRKVPSS